MEEACLGVGSVLFQVIRGVTSSKMTSLRLVPSECTSIQETMETLALNFSIDSVVVKALLETKIQNLEEFRFLFEDESKVDTFLAKIPLGEDRLIQGSRLRRAWTAVMLYYKTQDQDRSKISLSDLDTMLADSELRDVKSSFWVRYRMRYPPEIHPADATLSRVSRELSKRMLCVYSLWKVRTLQYQLHTTQKKRKLAEGLYTEEVEDDDRAPHDWESYMDRMLSLMLAYAMAGVTPRADVRDASGQLRKTIDRISARTMKRLNFKRMLGLKSVFVVRPAPSSHVPFKVLFKGLHLQILDGKTLDSHFSHVQFSFQSFLSKQLQD